MAWPALKHDFFAAARSLIRTPPITLAALVTTLALGIGATSAIFSVVKAVLLTPLPYSEPERRVRIFSRWVDFDKTWLSTQEVVDYRQMATTLDEVAAWNTGQQNLTGDGEPIRIGVGFVTANGFDVFGATPLLGRTFTAVEDRPDGPPVAVLGYPLWQARYAGDPGVIGRTMLVNDEPVEIVGVMREGFRLPTDFAEDAAEPTQIWRPLQIDEGNLNRGNHGLFAAATLAPGHTATAATEELRTITARLTAEGQYPEAMRFSAFAVPFDDDIRGGVRPAMWLLVGAVVFVLLIACANVANLLLVRSDGRVRELAVRTAIGAGPDRLTRQLLAESLLLAVTASALGLVLAFAGVRMLTTLASTTLPTTAPVELDAAVVLFTLVLGVATTVVFGLVPALRARRVNLVDSLREGNQQATIGSHRQRLRAAMVVAEVALAAVLVIGASLMIQSLAALGRIDLGFEPDHMLTMRVSLPTARYENPEDTVRFFRRLNDRVRAVPGVRAAGVMRTLPLATTIGDWGVDVAGFEERPGQNAKGDWQVVSDGAFEAMGTRLLRGRVFTATDITTSAPVVVVNETMARMYWRDRDAALGGRMRVGSPTNPWATVVGIVADERHNGVTDAVKEKFYVPHSQWHVTSGGSVVRNVFVVVRTDGDPLALAATVRGEVRALDPNLPVANIRPMTDVVGAALATSRLTGFLMGTFAAIALLLGAVGLYGVLSYLVAQRTREIGIRLTVGASRVEVLGLVLRHALALTLSGVGIGVTAAFGLSRLLQTLLYDVTPADPATFVGVPLLLLVVALAASALPALRATRVNPLQALRSE